MQEIVCKYHPEFKNSSDLKRYGVKYADIFNIERLVEESLAAVGGYDFVDEAGRDFNDKDNSDSKTVTVVCNSRARSAKVIIIGNVQTKIGSLRVTSFNPFRNRLDYFYIPKSGVDLLKENDGAKKRTVSGQLQRIRSAWSEKNQYTKLEKYRVPDFEALAQASD
jgi:hypothetical protein